MCGRYTTEIETDERELFRMLERAETNKISYTREAFHEKNKAAAFVQTEMRAHPFGEVFPSDSAIVLAGEPGEAGTQSGNVDAFWFRWGYPTEFCGKKRLLINARSETAGKKALFSESMREHRCVIPTAGFFEWMHVDGKADAHQKYRFNLPGTGLLYLAGLFRDVLVADDTLVGGADGQEIGIRREFVILTREANASMAPIHNRMPVIVRAEHIEEYLFDTQSAMRLLDETPPVLIKRLVS